MKYISISFIVLWSSIYAAPGCLDNSYHLKIKNDPGTWHHVQCSCPCGKPGYRILANGMCANCRHRRDPQPLTTIHYDRQKPGKDVYPATEKALLNLLTKLSK